VIDETSMIWFALRERRASLAGHSKVGDSAARRQTFAAAMAQFEEQMTAAKVVSPATRPLNLYYGLAQAGMAVAAAHAPDPWSFSRHGLKLPDRGPELADMLVTTEGEGAFQKVATATGSPIMVTPVSFGALWASLPDLAETANLPGSTMPMAIELIQDDFHTSAPRATLYLRHQMPAKENEWIARFSEILARYPGTQGWRIPTASHSIQPPVKPGTPWEVIVQWPELSPWQDPPQGPITSFFDRIAPEYRYRGERFLRPSVEDGERQPPSALMTWWLLLFSCSILARYYPRKWVRLLDLDNSASAVALQYALEVALSAIPHLVLEALDADPWLPPRPASF
jgi:hypothetical protein